MRDDVLTREKRIMLYVWAIWFDMDSDEVDAALLLAGLEQDKCTVAAARAAVLQWYVANSAAAKS